MAFARDASFGRKMRSSALIERSAQDKPISSVDCLSDPGRSRKYCDRAPSADFDAESRLEPGAGSPRPSAPAFCRPRPSPDWTSSAPRVWFEVRLARALRRTAAAMSFRRPREQPGHGRSEPRFAGLDVGC